MSAPIDTSVEAAAGAFLERLQTPPDTESAAPEAESEVEPEAGSLAADDVGLGPDEAPEGEWATADEGVADSEEAVEAEEGEEYVEEVDYDPATPVPVTLPDGTTETVPLSELRNGYLRQSDYTRKTQALAAERKEAEAGIETLRQYTEHMGAVAQELEGHLSRFRPDPAALAELERTDPGQAALLKMQEGERIRQLEEAKALQAQAEAGLRAAEIPKQRQALAELVPEFSGDRFDKEYAELGAWVTNPEGGMIDAERWAEEIDSKLIRLAWMACQYSKLAKSVPKVRKKIEGLPKVARPGTPLDPGQTVGRTERAATERLRSEGSVDAAAAVILARRQGQRRR